MVGNINDVYAHVCLSSGSGNGTTKGGYGEPRPSVDIEVRFKKPKLSSLANTADLMDELQALIRGLDIYNSKSIRIENIEKFDRIFVSSSNFPDGQIILWDYQASTVLVVQKLSLQDVDIKDAQFHVYTARNFGAMPQDLALSDEAGADAAIGSHHYEMPCQEFDDLWETLIYDDNIKNELLSYAFALLKLSDSGANTSVLAINRIILLHGPPGTGKTSLCKALAQRLSIRLGKRYKRSVFIEINSHSLFSKWFSESGKLIGKLFDEIEELAADRKLLIFVLIDEVESLTMGRSAAFSGADPSDSVRAVNAVLTQLDKIKKHPNVLMLATSNITAALDSAFLDRTDICRLVGNPSSLAAYQILSSAIAELQRIAAIDGTAKFESLDATVHERLTNVAKCCAGLSGRTIRKLPVLAYSKLSGSTPGLQQFLNALERVVDETIASAKK